MSKITDSSWPPSADLKALSARASMLQKIREFFQEKQVLEVETPLLSAAIGTDPHIDPIKTNQGRFLQTSPEFHMKRLLSSGSGDIYQICKAFREGDLGRNHNPEFTILEWYRIGFTLEELMSEVVELVRLFLPNCEPVKLSYRQAFMDRLAIDPFILSIQEIKEIAANKVNIQAESDDKDFWLDLLFTHCIEKELPGYCLLYNFPVSQAALAKTEKLEDGYEIARRFELIINGLEVANAYDELTNVNEQRHRFEKDQRLRKKFKRINNPIDENFIKALECGLPESCGVALGLDRLLMLMLELQSIEQVISFSYQRA